MTRSNPVCPGCKSEVTEMSFGKNFIFVDGVRHSAGWTWNLGCCGAHLLDEELEWHGAIEDESVDVTPVWLADKQGNVVLKWLDHVPQPEETGTDG